MTTRTRKTMNLDAEQSAWLAAFLDEGSPEHEALEQLAGRSLSSDSEELAALAMIGARQVRQTLLAADYDHAVDVGAFDETRTTARANRRRRRTPVD